MVSVAGARSRAPGRPQSARVYSARTASGPGALLADLTEGLQRQSVWRAFAWDEIQQRYRRSVLGLAWLSLSYLFFVFTITIFFRGFSLQSDDGFIAYVAVGYACFTFLTGNLVDGCAVFTSNNGWIKSASLPYSVYVYKSIARSLFTFTVQILSGLAVLILFAGWRPSTYAVLALPVLAVYLLNAVWVQTLSGTLAARWQDVQHLLGTLQRLLLFTAPVLWVYEERAGTVRRLADVNPLTHFIELLRAPLLGSLPSAHSVWFVAAFTVIGWTVTLVVAGRLRRRIPFWV